MATIDDFQKLEIRVGRIVEIEDHDAARKPMFKLTVDFGPELGKRTIVAGIRIKYTKEELMGKELAFIVNLDPRNIAGIESQGMLLAADDGERIAALVPDKEISEGSMVR